MATVVSFFNLFRISGLAIFFAFSYPLIGKKALYWFLRLSGPSFIKLGQTLACRPDLVGEKLAAILSDFQDRLPPEPYKKISIILKQQLSNHQDIFLEFSKKAVASASIAQVHKAKILDPYTNKSIEVAVKILHTNIEKIFARDIATLKIIVKLFYFFSEFFYKTLTDIANLLEQTSKNELNLLREAACASRFKHNLKDLEGFYIPEIYWKFCSPKILVSEWIDGIPFSDHKKIFEQKIDKKIIARNLVISYFTQVYENGFFHADMHEGNLFLMPNGKIAAVDFGIVGIIDKKTRIAIAEILIAFLNHDYQRVAKLHIDAGLVPKDINQADFALACTIIGEPIVGADVKDISLAKLLGNLLTMTRDYKMSTRPDLLLLQKTLMLVEGVGVMLDKDLNMWQIARPWVKKWASTNIGFDAKIRDGLVKILEGFKELIKSK